MRLGPLAPAEAPATRPVFQAASASRSLLSGSVPGGPSDRLVRVAEPLARDLALDEEARRRGSPSGLARVEAVTLDADEMVVPIGPGRTVIDVPAGMRRKALEVVVRAADAVVAPVQSGPFDEAGIERFLEVLREFKPVRKGRRPNANVVSGRAHRKNEPRFAQSTHLTLPSVNPFARPIGDASRGRRVHDDAAERERAAAAGAREAPYREQFRRCRRPPRPGAKRAPR